MSRRLPSRHRRPQSGFTLIEILVVLIVLVQVIVAVLALFDFNNKLSHVQTQLADMQQSQRISQYEIVRMLRMAGRGGLRSLPLPQSAAIGVRNRTPNDTTNVAIGNSSTTSMVVKNTDVLTLRGVFSTPIVQANSTAASNLVLYDAAGTRVTDRSRMSTVVKGMVEICNMGTSGLPQDATFDSSGNPTGYLKTLRNLITTDKRPEALVLVSPIDTQVYGVVEFDPAPTLPLVTSTTTTSSNCLPADPTDTTKGVLMAFKVGNQAGTARADAYRRLFPGVSGLPADLIRVATVGVLEEYRYYVRQEFEVAGQATSEAAPRLSRARFYPNTEEAYADDDQNLRQDIADDVIDLQVALGIDKDGNGVIDDAGSATDEWLYNNPADDDTATGGWGAGSLQYVRVSTVVRTDRRDPKYQAPLLGNIEDRRYTSSDYDNQDLQRMFRRRLLQTVVKMRNLG